MASARPASGDSRERPNSANVRQAGLVRPTSADSRDRPNSANLRQAGMVRPASGGSRDRPISANLRQAGIVNNSESVMDNRGEIEQLAPPTSLQSPGIPEGAAEIIEVAEIDDDDIEIHSHGSNEDIPTHQLSAENDDDMQSQGTAVTELTPPLDQVVDAFPNDEAEDANGEEKRDMMRNSSTGRSSLRRVSTTLSAGLGNLGFLKQVTPESNEPGPEICVCGYEFVDEELTACPICDRAREGIFDAYAEDDDHTGRFRRKKETCCEAFIREMNTPMPEDRRRYYRRTALENLGVEAEDSAYEEPKLTRMARRFRLLEALIYVEMKRVQMDEEDPKNPELFYFVVSLRFEIGVGVINAINLLCIGADTYYTSGTRPGGLVVADHLILLIFIIEAFLRIRVFSWVWLLDRWNFADMAIIMLTGVIPLWLFDPLGIEAAFLRRFGALRALRLIRVVRAIRLMPYFGELWTLVLGICSSSSLLFWALVIIGTVHFMFAVAFVDIFAKSDEYKDDEEIQRLFGTLWGAVLTLFQTMTADSWADKARPMIFDTPSTAHGIQATAIWFLFLGVCSFVLFNLLTAIVLEKAMKSQKEDTDAVAFQKQYEYLKTYHDLMSIFADMDEDGSGYLTEEEFFDVLDDVAFIRKMKILDIDLSELPDIFEVLDDGDGRVSSEEFVVGMMRLQGPAMSRDMLKATKKMALAADVTKGVNTGFAQKSEETLQGTTESLGRAHRSLIEVQQITAGILQKIDKIGIRHASMNSTPNMPAAPQPDMKEVLREESAYAKRVEAGVLRDGEAPPTADASKGRAQYLPPSFSHERQKEKNKKEVAKAKSQVANMSAQLRSSTESSTIDDGEESSTSRFRKRGTDLALVGEIQNKLETLSLDIGRFSPDFLRLAAKIPKDELLRPAVTVQRIHRTINSGQQEQDSADEKKKKDACTKCGNVFRESDLFCPKCGKKRQKDETGSKEPTGSKDANGSNQRGSKEASGAGNANGRKPNRPGRRNSNAGDAGSGVEAHHPNMVP